MDEKILTIKQRQTIGDYTGWHIRADPTCFEIGACKDNMIKNNDWNDFILQSFVVSMTIPEFVAALLTPKDFFPMFLTWLYKKED